MHELLRYFFGRKLCKMVCKEVPPRPFTICSYTCFLLGLIRSFYFRTLTSNMVVGVSKGFDKKLQLIGVGYRAVLEGNILVLSLGFSHPVRMTVPQGLQVKVEENTRITVTGYDKSEVGQFAASIRKWRPPEPYKGKGVKYADEIIRRKEGKAGKKK